AANKIDLPSSRSNVARLAATGNLTVPSSAEAELALRRAAEKGLISYKPGDSDFSPGASAKLTLQQEDALEMIRKQVLSPNGVNARSGMRLGESYVLNHGDIVSIVSASGRK